MSLGVNAFRPPGAAGATHLWVAADGETVIAKGTTATGRAAVWLSEAFGEGKARNRTAIRAFVAAVTKDYGAYAGDAVEQQFRARVARGNRPSGRHVDAAIATATAKQAERNELMARGLADLGASDRPTQARNMIEGLVQSGHLSREEADGLLAPGSQARTELEANIRLAVQNTDRRGGPMIGMGDALAAVQREVQNTAQSLRERAYVNPTAGQLVDLGAVNRRTPARDMIERRVQQGFLSREHADELLAPGGKAREQLE